MSEIEKQARREEWGRGEERKRDGKEEHNRLCPEFCEPPTAYRTPHAYGFTSLNAFTSTYSHRLRPDIASLALVVRAPSKGCL